MKLWQVSVVVVEVLRGTGVMFSHLASAVEQTLANIDLGLGGEPLNHIHSSAAQAAGEHFVAKRVDNTRVPDRELMPDFDTMTIQQIADYQSSTGEQAHGGYDA